MLGGSIDSGSEDQKNGKIIPPKKPLTPYMLFVRDMRPFVMKTMPSIAPLDIMKEVGRRWKKISEPNLIKYRDLALKDIERYKKEHKEFVDKINLQRKQAYQSLMRSSGASIKFPQAETLQS